MKKTLLLSVVASTMIMAGGDIAPAQEAAAPAAVSGWDFSGQAVIYYQTNDASDADLFDQDSSRANAGIQLRAVNANLFNGIGAGVEVTGVSTLGLQEDIVSGPMQATGTSNDAEVGGWVSQAYLTGGFGNTTVKLGRQELPKALSPFAFSESWNVFKNTFDAALVVNSDLPDTLIVGAWVAKANQNGVGADMAEIDSVNPDWSSDDGYCPGSHFDSGDMCGEDDGVWMLTVQNKSIQNLTLTGTWYHANEFLYEGADNLNILWGDAHYTMNGLGLGLQGGTMMHDDFADDATAWGAKVSGSVNGVALTAAYSSTDEYASFTNVGGVKTPLYTQLTLNQSWISTDSDTFVVKGSMAALGGKLSAAYNLSDTGSNGDYTELDLIYTTKVLGNTDLYAGYIYQDADAMDNSVNNVRVWGRYNF